MKAAKGKAMKELQALITLTVISVSIGAFIGGCCCDLSWRYSSVKSGHAEYDSQTGAWQWKELEAKR